MHQCANVIFATGSLQIPKLEKDGTTKVGKRW